MGLAIYHYLLNLNLDQDELALKKDAESTFVGVAGRTLTKDDSYWPLALITNADQCLKYGSREIPAHAHLAWADAKTYAVQCVANDMQLFGPVRLQPRGQAERDPSLENLSILRYDELISKILTDIPPRIIAAYNKLIAQLGTSPKQPMTTRAADDSEDYGRASLTRQFEFFMTSVLPPFSTSLAGPHDYRAYDLTGAEQGDAPLGNAILIVQIQT